MGGFKDSDSRGFGNEPDPEEVEKLHPNGRVLNDSVLPDVTYGSRDEHYEAVEALMESAPTDAADASKKVGYKPEDYEKRAAQAAQTLLSLDDDTEKEAEEVGLAERLTTIEHRFGFIPRSKQELSDTYDLTGKDLVAGAATHLNTVLNRQKKYMEDPERTVRAIVARYVEYARSARSDYAFMRQAEVDMGDGKGGLHLASFGTEWRHSGSLSRPVMRTLWSRDVRKFMRDGEAEGVDPLKALTDGEYAASNLYAVDAAQAMITGGKKAGFAEEFQHAMQNERDRFDFWVNALQEARKHQLAAPIAYGALVDLGIEKDERK